MKKVIIQKKFQLTGDFEPSINVGDRVRPGVEVGIGRIPDVLARYEIGKGEPMVDDGTYITQKTPLLEYRKGLRREIVSSIHDGIVRVRDEFLDIVSDEKEETIKATVWGKLLSIGEQEYTIEAKHIVLPIFVGTGEFVNTEIHLIFDKGMVIKPSHITKDVEDKLVILHAALTKNVYDEAVKNNAAGILAPSIDWNDYLEIFKAPAIGIGIIHGLGMFPLWKWYRALFEKLNGVTLEVNFDASYMHVPVSDILLGSLPKEMILFKDFWWGKHVKELAFESGEYIAVLETGEKTPVLAEELFNIR